MGTNNYIPENIYDMMAVKRLRKLPFETVKEDVPKLLEWLQDAHWDVAEGIAEYLIAYVNEITDELLAVLGTTDGMWKYWIINMLIKKAQYKLDPNLIEALKRIAEHPTWIEAEDGVDDVAKLAIADKHLCGWL